MSAMRRMATGTRERGGALLPAHAAETWGQALREGDVIVDLRARYESVEQGGFASDAGALTNRLRAGFQTAPLKGTAFLAEGVLVDDLVEDYNSTTNGQTQYPVVADPADFAAINRFALINKSLERTTLTFGRQRIVHDDQRFVGNVGWRQHEQTFDGLRAQWGSPKIKTDLTYAAQVNRVFGPDSPQGKWEGDVVLANFAYTLPVGTLTLFDYYLDIDGVASASSNTVGVKLAGSKPIGKLTGTYALAFAQQAEAGANAVDVDADYELVEGGLTFAKFGVALGLELLGGDGVAAFSTPLATLHAFQGWADKFLATPAAGIEDAYVRFNYPLGKRGRFHERRRGRGLSRLRGRCRQRALRRGAEPPARRAHGANGIDGEVRRLPRGRLVHGHRKALALRRLLVLTVNG